MNKLSVKSPVVSRAATLAAAAILGLTGARTVNIWLHTDSSQPEPTINHPHGFVKPSHHKTDYRRLSKLHLFGEVKKTPATDPLKQEIIKAPETSLNLKLIGVLFDRGNEDGYAIISESGKPQEIFHKGDKLPGNATLYVIEPNRVILTRNGRHETLTLIKPDLHAKGPAGGNEKLPSIPIQSWIRSTDIKDQSPPADGLKTSSNKESTF